MACVCVWGGGRVWGGGEGGEGEVATDSVCNQSRFICLSPSEFKAKHPITLHKEPICFPHQQPKQ